MGCVRVRNRFRDEFWRRPRTAATPHIEYLGERPCQIGGGQPHFAALLAGAMCRMVLTTTFDPVVEKAVAEMSGKPLPAYHLDGAQNAVLALQQQSVSNLLQAAW